MPKIRCDADEHYYDPQQHASCPHCRNTVVQQRGGESAPAAPPAASALDSPVPRQPKAQAEAQRKTVLQWARRPRSPAQPPGAQPLPESVPGSDTAPSAADAMDQAPVVGWLVVVAGPGRGRDLRIGPGMNWIGRDPAMDIALDFGDAGISAREHAVIIYDVQCNGFFLKHERGRNLTRLNDQRVTGETPLAAGDRIRIHDTELLFVALCDEGFQWA